jgi:4-hydroxybenzoate polyprenyltransferase
MTERIEQGPRVIPIIKLIRPHQWVKNAFVAAPLFFTPRAVSSESVVMVIAGFACFCVLSSGVYVLNDFLDREADRQHPTKRSRPLAAGTVSVPVAIMLMVVLIAGGLAAAALLNLAFAGIALAYFLVNLGYSTFLKRASIIDVMLIALGFVLRVYAGGALIGVEPSVWIISCTMLLALFIALAKRRDDLVKGLGNDHRESLAGYSKQFLDTSLAVVLASLLVSYLLYTTQPENRAHFGTDHLYLTVPFVVAGVLRYLQITLVEERSGTPTRVVLTDGFLRYAVLGWLATFAVLIYG